MLLAGCGGGGQEAPERDTAPREVSPEPSPSPTQVVVAEGLDTCDPVENVTFEDDDSFSFDTADKACKGMFVGYVLPPSQFVETSVSSGRVMWELVTEDGIVIGNLSARLTESGWILDTGEWCAV